MIDGWEIKTLGDVSVMMADGPFGSNLKKEHYTENREVRIIQLSNIGEDGWREENTKYTTFKHLETIQRSEVFPNDIVIAKMMPAGRAIICPNHEKKFVLSSDAVKVQLKKGINLRFAWYSINSPYFRKQVYENVAGSGRVRTSLTKLKVCKLRLPSLPEQQRIVAILDQEFAKIDAMKSNAEKSLQAAKDLFQATLKKELEPKEGWKKKRIGDLCEIYNGGTPSTSIDEYWDGGIQWITPKDMGKSKEMYVARCERTISQEGVEHSSTKVLPVRSVIVSSRAPIGYVAINDVPMATNQGCKGFVLGKELYPEFLYYFLLASTELLNKLGTGATFKEVSGKKLADIALDYPDIERQQEIAKHILSFSHSCSILQTNYQKTLALCDDLKQALLRKAFNGEL